MKRLALALALIIMVLGANIAISITPPKHVNPALIGEKPPLGLGIITVLKLIVTLASTMNFSEALTRIGEIEEAYMPRELSYAYKKFTELFKELVSHTERARNLTIDAEKLLSEGRYPEAEKNLNTAEDSLRRAEIIMEDLLDASRILSRIIPQRELASEIEKLRGLIDSLRNRISELREQLRAQLMEARDTEITVNVSPLLASPGQFLNVEGELREASGDPIAGRKVTITAGSSKAEALTDRLGRFKTQVRVNDYTRIIEVKAIYTPVEADRFLYKPSISEAVPVEVLFYTPRLKTELSPDKTTPGGSVKVVIETEPGARVEVIAFGKTTANAGADGVATATLYIPDSVKPGDYQVVVNVLPEGVRGPASQRLTLTIYKIPLNINIELPERVLAGSHIPIKVTAQTDSIITICIEGTVCERAVGSEILVEPQTPLISGGYVDITVKADPLNPAYASAERSFQVYVVNWLSIALSLTLLAVAVVLIAYPALKLARARIRRPAIQAIQREAGVIGDAVSAKPRAGGDVVRILIDFVATLTGVSMLASHTLREFLSEVRLRAFWVYEVIRKPILLLERFLYGRPLQNLWDDLVREVSEALERLRRAGGR
ncbi:MAG: hypothetical protein QXI22_09210 [Sulfolobales archaeon]